MSPHHSATLWYKMTNKVGSIWADFLIRKGRWRWYSWARWLPRESPLFKNTVLPFPLDKKRVILVTMGTFLGCDSGFKLKYFNPKHDRFTTLKSVGFLVFFLCLNPTRLYEQCRGNITFSCQSDFLNEISRVNLLQSIIFFLKTYEYCQQNFHLLLSLSVSLSNRMQSTLTLFIIPAALSLLVYVTETAAVAVAVLCQAICLSQTD